MKKFIAAACAVVLVCFALYYAYFHMGIYIDLHPDAPVTTFMKTDEDTIYMERDGEHEPFEIRGVNLGVGLPGEWATDYAIDEETYLRWFQYIQELGANTIRVYTLLQDDFYNAFYKYNTAREAAGEEPLWLSHGVWVNDYTQFSHRDAYDDDFLQTLLEDSRTLVDVLHGKKSLSLGRGLGSGSYRKDVSGWVIGYILGVEWEDVTVAYTNEKYPDRNQYHGTYMYTTEDATPFEAMLAQVGDNIIEYESTRYKQQRLVAFSNWPTTDPFLYPVEITNFFMKCAPVDVEHIKTTEAFQSGYFASYHVYPYYPDYLHYVLNPVEMVSTDEVWTGVNESSALALSQGGVPIEDYLTGDTTADFYDSQGRVNTYYAYLKALNNYHDIPVVISEYGVSTGRGMAQRDINTGRSQGHMTEQEQGQALIDCYKDIMDAGSAGSCAFTWQDEWFKRTWNTMANVDLDNTPYWSDYQTNEQYFGLLAFDPGEEESVCYVDGDPSEWTAEDVVLETGGGSLSMKYDEKFIYFYAQGFDPQAETIYIPIDTTPKTGTTYCQNYGLTFQRPVDFVIRIDGTGGSRVVVQERYEVMRALYLKDTEMVDAYVNEVDVDTPVFKKIDLVLQFLPEGGGRGLKENYETYETGNLRYGNANPDADDFDSLADYMFTADGVEIRIPWQLLNFSNPSEMMIHDDYYEHYGVENLHIDEMYVGLTWGDGAEDRISMASFPLEGWGKTVTYHERLKRSYYILQEYWAGLDS